MPNAVVKTFAQKTGKSEADVEGYWSKAKEIVTKDYPEIEKGSESFYKLIIGVLKKMLSIKTENEGGSIGIADVKAGYEPFKKYHTQKRRLKKTVTEAFDKIASMSQDDLGVFSALQNEGKDISVSMIENTICTDQLKESVSHIKIGAAVDTSKSESLLYLDSSIKTAIIDKHGFAKFVESLVGHMFEGTDLNVAGFEYPGYDLQRDSTYISVKSSSSRHTASAAYYSSNSVKSSALILSALYQMNPKIYKESCSFSDISDLLEFKEDLIKFTKSANSSVVFVVSYINHCNELCTHSTKSIKESQVLEQAFNIIETATGNARFKFFPYYSKLVEFCGGDEVTTIKLMDESEYATLRNNIIETITNIKDYELMCKIDLLLQ